MKKLFQKLTLLFCLLIAASPFVYGDADALANGSATSAGTQTALKVISVGATSHTLTYTTYGTTATITIRIEGSTDNGSTYNICTSNSTTLPVNSVTCVGTYDHIRVNILSLTGANPNVLWVLYSFIPSGGTGIASSQIQGAFPSGGLVSSVNPVLVAGSDSANIRPLKTDVVGGLMLSSGGGATPASGGTALTDAAPNNPIVMNLTNGPPALFSYGYLFNGTAWDRGRTNAGAAQTMGAPPLGVPAVGTAFISYSPTQLGVNALTLPASAATALSNIIDMRGAKQFTIWVNCTQGPFTVIINGYAEDGTTSLNGNTIFSACAAGVNSANYVATEAAPSGVCTGSGTFKLPQRAIAFQFNNTSAVAGTCTARLYVNY